MTASLLPFAAVPIAAAARGQATEGIRRKPGVRTSPAHIRPFPRAVVAPPFSGPRSRGSTEARDGSPRHRRPSAARARTPRMGPAPGGTTTALLPPMVTGAVQGNRPVARAGGSGYGRRSHSRCPGSFRARLALMALRCTGRIECPASVDRRTYPGPPALARSLGRGPRRTMATGHKPTDPARAAMSVSSNGRRYEGGSRQSRGIDSAPSTLTTLPVEKASSPEASAATARATSSG
jgi:hypothetical protein